MSNLTVENVYTRQTAKELTKKHFWKLLGMMLTVLVITYAAAFGCMALAGALSMASDSAFLTLALGLVAVLAIYLLISGLSLGLTASMIDICRGNDQVKVRQVFGRMGQCLKAFGLMLWIELKLFLWMLPAFAAMIFSFVALSFSSASTVDLYTGTQSIPADTAATTIGLILLPFLFMILMFALLIPAAYRYMLSTYILADKPETGVFDCVRQSKVLMKGHKWQAFKLMVPPLLIVYAIMLGVTLVLSLVTAALENSVLLQFMPIVIFIVVMLLALYYGLRISVGYCIFYLKRQGEMPCIPPEEEERIVCWQPGQAPQPAGEPVAAPRDEHIAGWQPTENKPDQE